jgi:hypothetical protein
LSNRGRPSIAEQVGQEFFDDADTVLGLRAGQMDEKGRPVVTLPQRDAYRPELEGKSPAEMAEILERDDEQREDADANNIEQIMREAPGGRTKHGGSHSGKRRKRRGGSASGLDETTIAGGGIEPPAYRPIVVSARVSLEGAIALKRASEQFGVSVGVMLDEIAAAYSAGVMWDELREVIGGCARVAAERLA